MYRHDRCVHLIFLTILALASLMRLYAIDFGLPALRDPDEPIFVLAGLRLLRDHTMNPAWFGHPGTTTIYSIALLAISVFAVGHATGLYPDGRAFTLAIYQNPSILFLPGRIMMALGGVLCVALTFTLGSRLAGRKVGLTAAMLLAVNPLHIEYSQLIRTDIQASVFTLGTMIMAVEAGRTGQLKFFLLSGVCAGFAMATKWPAAFCLAAPIGAGLYRMAIQPDEWPRLIRNMVAAMAIAIATLLAVSPFLLIDYPKLMIDLHGEERPRHLGATGSGLVENLGWYLGTAIRDAMGAPLLIAAAAGLVAAIRRNRLMLAILLPGSVLFLLAISAQHLVWARWVLLLLPLFSIFAAAAICWLTDYLRVKIQLRVAFLLLPLISLLLAAPMVAKARIEAIERLHDTRDLASNWVRAHAVPGSTILVEHFAFDLVSQHWNLLFPLGTAGCLDVDGLLRGRIRYSRIEELRQGRAIVDIGTVSSDKLKSCVADYLIISDYDRYLAEAVQYRPELGNYRRLMAGGQQQAVFVPVPGQIGGPTVRIIKLNLKAAATVVAASQSE